MGQPSEPVAQEWVVRSEQAATASVARTEWADLLAVAEWQAERVGPSVVAPAESVAQKVERAEPLVEKRALAAGPRARLAAKLVRRAGAQGRQAGPLVDRQARRAERPVARVALVEMRVARVAQVALVEQQAARPQPAAPGEPPRRCRVRRRYRFPS